MKNNSNINKFPLVICKWHDTVATDSNWRSEDDAIDWVDAESGIVLQTGFMLEKNDEYLILLDSFFEKGDTVGTVTRIPIETVKFIKIIPIEQLLEATDHSDIILPPLPKPDTSPGDSPNVP